MGEQLKHECGIAVVRLRKPLEYYKDKYGSALWGFQKLFLLMEKQHNRGQDGIGIGCCKINAPLGEPYMFRRRDSDKDALSAIFRNEMETLDRANRQGHLDSASPKDLREKFDFGGQILMGHLRYGTSGNFDEHSCHPYVRRSNWPTRTLMVMGNFNMTNAGQLNRKLIERGQHPVFGTDTQTVLEEVGFHLDEAHTELYRQLRDQGIDGHEIPKMISQQLDLHQIISSSAENWDGGFAIAGSVGNGDMFVMRDPRGIRPCSYFINDEVIAFASERVPLMTVFEQDQGEIKELKAGEALTVSADGNYSLGYYTEPKKPTHCSFENIYFSRGNDPEIYQDRKQMGRELVPQILETIDNDLGNSVFSFIPNTAEIAYYGLLDGLRLYRRQQVRNKIVDAIKEDRFSEELIDDLILNNWPRAEKIAHKDIKLRTFISQESDRNTLASHVYDITYGVVKPEDNLVVLEDSIVRGTTLKRSVLKILARLNPKKLVVCSTAPQIRYPDCYGIDMSEIGKFIAFQAAANLHQKNQNHGIFQEIYDNCIAERDKGWGQNINCVQALYAPFTDEEISAEISRIAYPEETDWKGELEIVYLSVEKLHTAISNKDIGDWYFTGEYPTPGGYAAVNQAYINYFEKRDGRSYDLPI